MYLKQFILSLLVVCISITLVSCAATYRAIRHRNLESKTKMSKSIFLNPPKTNEKVVYVQFQNTTDKTNMNAIQSKAENILSKKGYKITDNISKAHYLLQVNLRKAGQAKPEAFNKFLQAGYGAYPEAAAGAAAGAAGTAAMGGDTEATAAGGLIGSAVGTVASAAVENVHFAAVADVRLKERTNKIVTTKSKQKLQQGTGGTTLQQASKESHWKIYQTRIVSMAHKVNLDWEDARPVITKGIAHSMAGLLPK